MLRSTSISIGLPVGVNIYNGVLMGICLGQKSFIGKCQIQYPTFSNVRVFYPSVEYFGFPHLSPSHPLYTALQFQQNSPCIFWVRETDNFYLLELYNGTMNWRVLMGLMHLCSRAAVDTRTGLS